MEKRILFRLVLLLLIGGMLSACDKQDGDMPDVSQQEVLISILETDYVQTKIGILCLGYEQMQMLKLYAFDGKTEHLVGECIPDNYQELVIDGVKNVQTIYAKWQSHDKWQKSASVEWEHVIPEVKIEMAVEYDKTTNHYMLHYEFNKDLYIDQIEAVRIALPTIEGESTWISLDPKKMQDSITLGTTDIDADDLGTLVPGNGFFVDKKYEVKIDVAYNISAPLLDPYKEHAENTTTFVVQAWDAREQFSYQKNGLGYLGLQYSIEEGTVALDVSVYVDEDRVKAISLGTYSAGSGVLWVYGVQLSQVDAVVVDYTLEKSGIKHQKQKTLHIR